MKTFYLTEEEFNMNPIDFIEKLYKEDVAKYGCIKLVPPKSFKPPMAFNLKSDKKMPRKI